MGPRGMVDDRGTEIKLFNALIMCHPDRFKDLPAGDHGVGALGRYIERRDWDSGMLGDGWRGGDPA